MWLQVKHAGFSCPADIMHKAFVWFSCAAPDFSWSDRSLAKACRRLCHLCESLLDYGPGLLTQSTYDIPLDTLTHKCMSFHWESLQTRLSVYRHPTEAWTHPTVVFLLAVRTTAPHPGQAYLHSAAWRSRSTRHAARAQPVQLLSAAENKS